MSRELMQSLEQLAREKGLPLKVIVDAMVSAIELAARKRDRARFDVEYDEATGGIRLYEVKTVVETVADPKLEMSVPQARKIRPNVNPGDDVYLERDIADLGRIAAQKAKQIINQKVKEAEKHKVYDMYRERLGDVVLATVQRIENGVIVNLGESEALLPRREQIPGEFYKRGDKFRAMITEVTMSSSGKWPQIILSRTSDEFLFRLFEIEVPEIAEGIVEIVGVARDPGARAKICVRSFDRNVDPVGACVGMRGSRIQSIVRELRGEKIDIIEWSDDPAVLIARVMTPAKVQNVIVDDEHRSVDLIVADDQLALAIGKRGQNAKLAVKLTQWRINITSESERRAALQDGFEEAIARAEQAEYFDQDDDDGYAEAADADDTDLTRNAEADADNAYLDDGADADINDDDDADEYADDDDDNADDAEDGADEYADAADAAADDDAEKSAENGNENAAAENDQNDHAEPAPPISSETHDFLHSELLTLNGVSERMADQLEEAGFFSIEEIASSSVEELLEVPGVGEHTARRLLAAAQAYLAAHEE
jgi:transcription termination/antitermination protein NusA